MTREEANRQNALNSTGPRTPEGKATVAQNALKHGIYSEATLIPQEDPDAFDAVRLGMLETLNPIGAFEEMLVDRLASLWWRLARASRVEWGGLGSAMERNRTSRRASMIKAGQLKDTDPTPIGRGDFHVAFLAWTANGEGHMERIGRYENALERSFFRLLHELERMQGRRQGQSVPPPAVVDVNIDGA